MYCDPGTNICRLDRALESVELKPTYEDLFQVENSSVEDYLKQMHELTVLTAIQVGLVLEIWISGECFSMIIHMSQTSIAFYLP